MRLSLSEKILPIVFFLTQWFICELNFLIRNLDRKCDQQYTRQQAGLSLKLQIYLLRDDQCHTFDAFSLLHDFVTLNHSVSLSLALPGRFFFGPCGRDIHRMPAVQIVI